MNLEKTSMKEYLQSHDSLTYRFAGVSMRPMLRQESDLVTIVPYDGKGLQKYDVALYEKESSNKYILHRVVDVMEKDGKRIYTFLGDNCPEKEPDIPDETIIAVLKEFYRGDKKCSVMDKGYRIYSKVHYFFYPLRRVYFLLRKKIVKIPFARNLYHKLFKRGKKN